MKFNRIWQFVASVAIMVFVAFAYFYPDAAMGNVLQQPDIQQGAANGEEIRAYAEATGVASRWTGSLFSGMPTFQISPTYPSNRLFAWIGTVMGAGLPSPANLLLMMMVGMFILLMAMRMRWYVALLGAIGYGLSSYFIIIIGAGHIWKFVTLAYIPPTLAGIVLCYRGRYLLGGVLTAVFTMMQIAANHVQMTYYFLFVVLGFVLVYLWQAWKTKGWKQFGIATAVLIVSAGLGITANLPNLYNTYEYSHYTMRGGHSELQRADEDAADATSGLDRSYITQYSYERSELFSLLIPNIKGGASAHIEQGRMVPSTLAELPEARHISDQLVQAYLGNVRQYFGGPEGTNGPVYVGALIFALFLLGCVIVKGPWKWMLLVLTLFSLLLALGRNMQWLTDLMIDYMPMYSKFRTVESILVVAEFTMPLLAAMALQRLFSEPEAWQRYGRATLWCFGISMLFCLVAFAVPSLYGDVISEGDRYVDQMITRQLMQQGYSQDQIASFTLFNPQISSAIQQLRYSMIQSDGLRSLVILGIGLITLVLYMRRKLQLGIAAGALCVVVLLDLFMVNKRYLNSESFVQRSLATGPAVPITDVDRLILQDTAMNYRVMDIPRFYEAAPSFYHKTVGGYHAAKLTRYQDIIDRHLSHFLENKQTDADWNVLNMLNARYIVDYGNNVIYNDEAYGNAWLVDSIAYTEGADAEMQALSTINPRTRAVADRQFEQRLGTGGTVSAGDTIYQTSYAPNRLSYKVKTAKGATAVFSEVWFPWGWNVTVDGKEVEAPARVDYILRAIPVPAGTHDIVMTFNPRSVSNTVTAATISVILIYVGAAAAIALAVVRYMRRRKSLKYDASAPAED